jgi:hypothetical protein
MALRDDIRDPGASRAWEEVRIAELQADLIKSADDWTELLLAVERAKRGDWTGERLWQKRMIARRRPRMAPSSMQSLKTGRKRKPDTALLPGNGKSYTVRAKNGDALEYV